MAEFTLPVNWMKDLIQDATFIDVLISNEKKKNNAANFYNPTR